MGRRPLVKKPLHCEKSLSVGNGFSSSIVVGTMKKSLRILMNSKINQAKNGRASKNKKNYVWPRTVEAARDPNLDDSGKNKMFYLIAIDLLPVSKVVQPSDSESDDEEENLNPVDNGFENYSFYDGLDGGTYVENFEFSPSPIKRVRRGRRTHTRKRLSFADDSDNDVSWRTAYNNQKRQPVKTQPRVVQPRSSGIRITEEGVVQEVIESVVCEFSKKYRVPKANTKNLFRPVPIKPSENLNCLSIGPEINNNNKSIFSSLMRKNAIVPGTQIAADSGDEEVTEAFTVRLEID